MFDQSDALEHIFEKLFVDIGQFIVAKRAFVPPFGDHLRRYAYGRRFGRDGTDDDRIGADLGIVTDRNVAQYFGPGTEDDTPFDRRVTFAFFQRNAS